MVQMQHDVQLSLFSAEEEAQQINAARGTKEAEDLPLLVDLRKLREVSRITTGFHEVYGEIFRQLGFDRLLGTRKVASSRASGP